MKAFVLLTGHGWTLYNITTNILRVFEVLTVHEIRGIIFSSVEIQGHLGDDGRRVSRQQPATWDN